MNNPDYIDFGNGIVVCIESKAQEIQQAKFGYYPLGWYCMEGKEVLHYCPRLIDCLAWTRVNVLQKGKTNG